MENKVKLSKMNNGDKTIIIGFDKYDEKILRRLIELGFVKNEKIEIIKNFKKLKTMLISIRGYLLSIDYVLAERIIVWKK